MPLQSNRIYSLIVGDARTGDGWEITDFPEKSKGI